MSKRYGKFSKFTFTAHASGQHYLCFQTNSTRFAVFAGEKLVRPMDTNRKFILDEEEGGNAATHTVLQYYIEHSVTSVNCVQTYHTFVKNKNKKNNISSFVLHRSYIWTFRWESTRLIPKPTRPKTTWRLWRTASATSLIR